MRITKFPKNEKTYSSNVYLIRGDFNSIKDVNTLIDAGGDDSILAEIEKINTGTGKKEIEQIIFTHDHFDHTIGAKFVKEKYKSKVLSFSKTKHTDKVVKNNEIVKVGDQKAQIIYIPGHSNDSICIFVPNEKALFSGDSAMIIGENHGTFIPEFIKAFEYISLLNIETIYPGHGEVIHNGNQVIKQSLQNIKANIWRKNKWLSNQNLSSDFC